MNSTISVNGWPVIDMFLFKYLSLISFHVRSFAAPVKDGVSFPSIVEENSKYPFLNASISPVDQFSFLRGFFDGVSMIVVWADDLFVYNLWQIRAKREFYLQWRVKNVDRCARSENFTSNEEFKNVDRCTGGENFTSNGELRRFYVTV